ncbi:metallophosphoesterase 1 homolog isoform X1 [Branchiostoma lanceolatum]|uniref:metallophosphoesterase 1 homolog isoform X1 n=1 Tax=Branchiostoma lanceolatum TaxID=7740 RepID=UPI0034541127
MDGAHVTRRRPLRAPNGPMPLQGDKPHRLSPSEGASLKGRQCCRLLTFHRTAVLVGALVVLYNEVLVYYINKTSWKLPPGFSQSRDDDKIVRLIIAGDPQIQGYQYEVGGLVGWVTRLDSDRYLSKTFHLLLDLVQPDAVVFLGDLEDEGSVASDVEYSDYVRRFYQIFHVPAETKLILLAGDNDIGGEGADMITQEKMQRFEKNFAPLNEVVRVKNVDFIKVNLVTPFQKAPAVPQTRLMSQLSAPVRVLLSHVTLNSAVLQTAATILGSFRPQYAFSAHFHKYERAAYNITRIMRYAGLPYPADLASQQLVTQEFQVPTCSYRMGTAEIGYMVVTIDHAGEMSSSVVWLPRRYVSLCVYVVYLIVVVLAWVVQRACLSSRRHHTTQY